MKRTLLVTFAFILMAGMAFAYGGMGRGQGMMGGGFGPGACGPCPQFDGKAAQQTAKAVTKEEAQKKAEEFMTSNLKGYKIDKTQEFQGRRGTMYNFFVKDSSGNKFILKVNPWGNVMGPFVAQQ